MRQWNETEPAGCRGQGNRWNDGQVEASAPRLLDVRVARLIKGTFSDTLHLDGIALRYPTQWRAG